tara:strand:- start:1460 stop:2119 length:660 start_codon:yes stop_codon:yes gene_type:complete
MIPTILHQTWKEKDSGKYKNCVDSWEEYMPNLQRRLYLDDDIDTMVKQIVPHYYSLYSQFNYFIEKIDFFRYVVLWEFGGIYADMDVECLQDINKLLDGRVVFPVESSFNRNLVGQFMMITPPRHRLWVHLMHYIIVNYSKEKYVPYNTGPDAVSSFFKEYNHRDDVNFLCGLQNGPYVLHRCTGVWRTKEVLKHERLCNICSQNHIQCNCYIGDWYNE